MEVYFEYIRDADGVRSACEELAREPYLGLDTETTELDPYRGEMRLVQISSGRKTFVFDMNPSEGVRVQPASTVIHLTP